MLEITLNLERQTCENVCTEPLRFRYGERVISIVPALCRDDATILTFDKKPVVS